MPSGAKATMVIKSGKGICASFADLVFSGTHPMVNASRRARQIPPQTKASPVRAGAE